MMAFLPPEPLERVDDDTSPTCVSERDLCCGLIASCSFSQLPSHRQLLQRPLAPRLLQRPLAPLWSHRPLQLPLLQCRSSVS